MPNNSIPTLNDITPIKVWGEYIRLVHEDDAEFITKLRSDNERTKFMLTLNNDVNMQKEWIQKYKIREKQGQDFYFIFHDSNLKPYGLYRIYNVDYEKKSAKGGAWIKDKYNKDYLSTIKMFLFQKHFGFQILGLETIQSDFHKNNTTVINYYKSLGLKIPEAIDNDFIQLSLKKDEYLHSANELLNIHNITQNYSLENILRLPDYEKP